jgi:hypothetical protein
MMKELAVKHVLVLHSRYLQQMNGTIRSSIQILG